MKKFIIMLAAVSAVAFTSCQSKKTLTDAAIVASPAQEVKEVAPITYTQQTQPTTQKTAPVVNTADKDRQEKVSVVNAGDAALLRDYNVIVGAFSRLDYANNFVAKMQQRGYTSFLVQNATGLYRVVAASFDNRAQAAATRDEIKTKFANDDPGTCPAAWLLIPAM